MLSLHSSHIAVLFSFHLFRLALLMHCILQIKDMRFMFMKVDQVPILFTGGPGASVKTIVLISLVPCNPDYGKQQLVCNLIQIASSLWPSHYCCSSIENFPFSLLPLQGTGFEKSVSSNMRQ